MKASLRAKRSNPRPILTVGVVLAGGSSRRMGEPKEHLRLPNGRTFLENALALLSRLTDMQIVAGGDEETTEGVRFSKSSQSRPPKPSYFHIMDLHPGEGPLAGIEAALVTQFGSGYLVIACDQVKLSVELLQRLLDGDANRIHAFEVNGSIVPLPVYVPLSARNSALNIMQGANRSVRHFIEANDCELVHLPSNDVPLLQSINTPEEYQDLLVAMASRVL